ncbi:MAG: hypothetical protein RL095_608 [Verrucomicrobiota bacterium]
MKQGFSDSIRQLLGRSPVFFVLFAGLAAFATYTSMYAFRKAFTVATYEGYQFLAIDYKIWLITAQVIGYIISKGIGIKVVAEMPPERRGRSILLLIGFAGLALIGFALVPPPWGIVFLFLNGLPLGMIFGIVFGFLEGRKLTDLLVLGLMLTFIFSSGFVKTVGKFLMNYLHVPEFWMPAATGAIFIPVLAVSVWMLCTLPPPSAEDVAEKTQRQSMNSEERRKFLRTFAPGLICFVLAYLLLTILRDFRDNFTAEIWRDLGQGGNASIFTETELPIALAIILLMGAFKWIKDSFKAFVAVHLVAVAGALLVGLSTLLYQGGLITPFWWISLVGMGLYVAYVPCNSLFFEHMIVAFRYVSTAGFLITTADFYGYFGSLGITLYKNFGDQKISYADFFTKGCYLVSLGFSLFMLISLLYFVKKYRNQKWQPQA